MLFNNWKGYYNNILNDFNFDIKKDIESAELLDSLILENNRASLDDLKDFIKGNKAAIFGAGPSLNGSVDIFEKNRYILKITADGATTAFIENNLVPDLVVTDLDGKMSDQLKANKKGSIVIVHAHGDNIDKIKEYVPKFQGKVLGTTQTDPSLFENIYNFGGFTDGDRCVFIADHFKAKQIDLIGFDYDRLGKYSFYERKDIEKKFKKLRWCKYLIDELIKENNSIKYYV